MNNCASYAMKTEFFEMDLDKMEADPVLYLKETYAKHNRNLRMLGKDFTEFKKYEEQLRENEWIVAFFGPYAIYKHGDFDEYSEYNLFRSPMDYHFILYEGNGVWSQMDMGSIGPYPAVIEKEIKYFQEYGCNPVFLAVSEGTDAV